jgi:hypothetical protein
MATQVVYRGPAPSTKFNRGARVIVFERDVPQAVEEEEFVAELLALNPDRHTLEVAAIYGTPIFELAGGKSQKPASREGVSS